jgi:hypothetical protein
MREAFEQVAQESRIGNTKSKMIVDETDQKAIR